MDDASKRRRRRRSSKSEPENLSRQEKAVIIAAGVAITWSFWTFGVRPSWSRIIFFMLCCAVPLMAILPPWGEAKAFFQKGLKSPVVWAGLIAVIYPFIQALNPAYTATPQENMDPIITPIEHISWLPSGVDAPMSLGNPWQHVMMFAGIFMVFASLRLVLERRKAWIVLLWITLINGSLMAFVGTLVHLSGADKILWLFESVNNSFFGTFYYKNHASSALYMTVALGWVLYFYHARQAKMKAARSGPHLFCLLLISLGALPAFATDSKAGMLLMSAVCLCGGGLWLLVWLNDLREDGRLKIAVGVLAVAVLVIVGVGSTIGKQIIDFERVEAQLTGLGEDLEEISDEQLDQSSGSNRSRFIAMTAFSRMLQERPALGLGAGSFEHFSREYTAQYPDIHYMYFHRKIGGWVLMRWVDAHSDWLEFPIEYGWGGFALLTLGFLVWLPGSFSFLKRPRLYLVFPWIGAGAMLGHAMIESVFQVPTLVLMFLMLWSSPWFFQNLKRA